jgi:2-polyprenyl-3-methyl-5-hydroxy-6-metoxy-1,4-benzoquinol methylase
MPWRDHGSHPNGEGPLRYRHKQLTRAATYMRGSRIEAVCAVARDKKVLDLGCVSHSFTLRSGGGNMWLHDHVVKAAAECVGADYDEVGIKEMQEAGYDVVQVDITGDLTPILERGPFDVVVAGEIIEHLAAPQQLLSTAEQVLRPGGKLVITTPNPYSPRRNRTAVQGITWENVDHVIYAFPSGIAEMADRTGLVLTKFGSVGWPGPKPLRKELRESFGILLRAVRGLRRGQRNPLSNHGFRLKLPTFWQSPVDVLLTALRGHTGMMKENAIYILTKPSA